MVDDFGEKLMQNKERKGLRNLRKGGLNMTAFNRRVKFVNVYDQLNVYTFTRVHGPSSCTLMHLSTSKL